MPDLIYVKNSHQIKVIFHEKDFIDLVEEHMGSDAAEYIRSRFGNLELDAENHEREVEEAYNQGAEDAWSHHNAETYDAGHDDGYEEGYDKGYGRGYDEGYRDGFEAGGERY